MKVTITGNCKDKDKVFHKEFEISMEDIAKKVTQIGVFSFIGREVNRVRPPKRNVGLIINWMTAAAVTDGIMALVYGNKDKEKKEDVVAEDDAFEEVKSDDREGEADTGEI